MREVLTEKISKGEVVESKFFFIDDKTSESVTQYQVEGVPKEFFPHGIAVKENSLVVVNHRTNLDSLEIFKLISE